MCKPYQIFKDQLVICSYILFMEFRIHYLHIIEEGVYIRKDLLEPLIGYIAAGIDGQRYILTLQFLCHGKDELHIHGHDFSAGKCYPSARFFVEHLILHKFFC